ncbi:MAG: DUF3786 domain-containing protein [Desulfatiglandaceae bacterium]
MPRVDDYYTAADLTRDDLSKREAGEVAEAGGAEIVKESSGVIRLDIGFLGRICTATWPGLVFTDRQSGKELTPQEQVLILHYLAGAHGNALTGKWISYQEIPDGRFYMDAFIRRAKNPLVGTFGSRPELLRDLAVSAYGASPFDHGDVSVVFDAFPYVPVVFILWEGDDEFPPDGNILFDESVAQVLSAEDTAWLAGMAVYPLIGRAKSVK